MQTWSDCTNLCAAVPWQLYETCVSVATVAIKCNGKYRQLEVTQQALLQHVIYWNLPSVSHKHLKCKHYISFNPRSPASEHPRRPTATLQPTITLWNVEVNEIKTPVFLKPRHWAQVSGQPHGPPAWLPGMTSWLGPFPGRSRRAEQTNTVCPRRK